MDERARRNIWKRIALVEPVNEIVLPKNLLDLTKTVARESHRGPEKTEQAGYLAGYVKDEKYFVTHNTPLGMDINGRVGLEILPKHATIYEEMISQRIPNYRTLLYHSHPRIDVLSLKRMCPPEDAKLIIEHAKKEMKSGIFDYLKDEGRLLTLDEVVNEMFSRDLSEHDLDLTPGNYHLLISSTLSEKNPFSHLNFYRIEKDRQSTSILKTRVRTPYLTRSISKELKTEEEIDEDYREKVLGFPRKSNNLDELAGMTQKQLDYSWNVINGWIDPETGKPTIPLREEWDSDFDKGLCKLSLAS